MAEQTPTAAPKFALIEAVRAEPFLYDTKHSDYHNLDKKSQTWAKIAATRAVNLGDGSTARATFDKMRTVYNRNHAKTCGGARHVKWQFFQAMTFLDRFRAPHADGRCGKLKQPRLSRNVTEKQEVEWEMDCTIANAVTVPMSSEDGTPSKPSAEPDEASQNAVAASVQPESGHLPVRYTPANRMILNATHPTAWMTFRDFRQTFSIPQGTQKVFIFKRSEEEWDVTRDDGQTLPVFNGRVEAKVYSDS
ncbi:hypothetical protein AAVH_22699 [Aphelenchoides avenae]|nr:hypothetical protein AAVH_22699 [Aphelenchus avenae]